MTEEEFRNLKVGDHFEGIHGLCKIEVTNYRPSYHRCEYLSMGGGFREVKFTSAHATSAIKLPLYNSPLYLAMSEADAPNEKSEEE